MSKLHVTCIQSSLHWQDKEANLKMFDEKIRAIEGYTEIVVLPEMFSTGFSMQPEVYAESMDGPTVSWMKKLSAEKRVIITGSVIIREEDKFYNRLIWMLPNGEYGVYDKRHLFGYAQEDAHYSQGNKRLVASVKGWRVNLMVCYDLRFPVWARQSNSFFNPMEDIEPEYDLIIYAANWPERRAHAWKTLLQARAIENQCYVVGLNRVGSDGNEISYSGDSMIIDPLGEVLVTNHGEEKNLSAILEKKHLQEVRTKFPFLKDADKFIIENLKPDEHLS
jgi:predicted amidohydrolase